MAAAVRLLPRSQPQNHRPPRKQLRKRRLPKKPHQKKLPKRNQRRKLRRRKRLKSRQQRRKLRRRQRKRPPRRKRPGRKAAANSLHEFDGGSPRSGSRRGLLSRIEHRSNFMPAVNSVRNESTLSLLSRLTGSRILRLRF